MKIYIYPQDGSTPSNYYELTPYIVNDFDEQTRCDDAFAITSFKCMIPATLFPLVKYNMAAFTIFEIVPDNETIQGPTVKRYFGSSKCTKYLREQSGVYYYTHEITLLEPLAYLEAIQIGTKTFTNHTDADYLNILSTLISNVNGATITFTGTWNSSEEHSFSFDKGTTAFEIANEIFRLHNMKMSAAFVIDNNPYSIRMTISQIDLSAISTIAIDEDYLTLAEYNQNIDDYCKNLESQVDNVVDRNTTSTWASLTPRSDDNNATPDNCYIELPAKIESVDKLSVYINATQTITIEISLADANALGDGAIVTWQQAIAQVSWLEDFADYVLNKQNNPNIIFGNYSYTVSDNAGYQNWMFGSLTGVITSDVWYDLTKVCLDASIYKALTPQKQPSYCYYTSGDNKIQGIYKYYKADWVHQFIGATANPMLDSLAGSFDFFEESDEIIATNADGDYYGTISYNVVNNSNSNPLANLFFVQAHPITNQYVKDVKSDTPINANSYVNTSRSYGNSANYIDYDIMRKNISVSNKSLGTPELTLEFLNTCSLVTNSKFNYDSKLWYVKSIITKILKDKITYTINAATDFNKQADSIGVRTQYQATKIALDNIKERHIYFLKTNSVTLYKSLSYYLKLQLSYQDGTSQKSMLLRCSLYYNQDKGITLVATALDNYSVGKYLADEDLGKFIQSDFPYVDSNGEAYRIDNLQIYSYANMTIADSRLLPTVPANSTGILTLNVTTNYEIYKDEHESLAFTIYLPNANLS